MSERRKDLRDTGRPIEPDLTPADPPEPLVVPPEELRQQYEEMVKQIEEEEATRVFYHFAEEIKLRSFGKVFGFMKMHMAIYRRSRELPGFVAGGIRGAWWKKRFYTYTAWDSQVARDRFTSSEEHIQLIRMVVGEYGAPGSGYVEWESNDDPEWEVAESRLKNPGHYYIAPDRYS